jgi:hypothetical protein
LQGDECSPCPDGAYCPGQSVPALSRKGYWGNSLGDAFFSCDLDLKYGERCLAGTADANGSASANTCLPVSRLERIGLHCFNCVGLGVCAAAPLV